MKSFFRNYKEYYFGFTSRMKIVRLYFMCEVFLWAPYRCYDCIISLSHLWRDLPMNSVRVSCSRKENICTNPLPTIIPRHTEIRIKCLKAITYPTRTTHSMSQWS